MCRFRDRVFLGGRIMIEIIFMLVILAIAGSEPIESEWRRERP